MDSSLHWYVLERNKPHTIVWPLFVHASTLNDSGVPSKAVCLWHMPPGSPVAVLDEGPA